MPEIKISDLPDPSALDGTDVIPVVDSGDTVKATITDILALQGVASGSDPGLMSAAHWTKLDGVEALADVTDAANVAAAGAVMTSRTISTTAPLAGGGDLSANRTLTISAADGSNAGSMSAANFTKLAGVETGAEVTSQAKVVAALAGGTVTGALTVTGSLKGRPEVVIESGTSLSYGDSQNGQRIYCSSGSPIALALNSGTAGTEFTVFAEGGGVITVTFAGGTVRVPPEFGAKTKQQYSPLTVSYKSATVVFISGHLGSP